MIIYGIQYHSQAKPENIGSTQAQPDPNLGNPTDGNYQYFSEPIVTNRGFTMHEHMDQFKLINMNGRVYDPVLAQFLSPDPFVANAASTMSYNRYAYCNYNPLKYVDPSGYVATENSMLDEIRRLWNSPFGGHWNASTGTHFYASYDEASGSVGGGYSGYSSYNYGNGGNYSGSYVIYLPRTIGLLGTPAGRNNHRSTGRAHLSMIRIPGWIANLFRSDGSGSPAYTPMTESQFTDTYGYMDWGNSEPAGGGKTNNKRPTFADMYLYFPKNNSGGTLPGPKVYERVGGKILQMYKANPSRYQNACALRVSFALNHSGVNIPNVEGTYTGEDGKFYFLSSGKLFSWLESYFGPPDITDISKMPDNIGIYIMQVNNPADFGALGHATLYDGSSCIGDCYFNPTGGVYKIGLWILPPY